MKATISQQKTSKQFVKQISYEDFLKLKYGVIYSAQPTYEDAIHYVSKLGNDRVIILAYLLQSGEVRPFNTGFNYFNLYYDNFELMPPGFSITLTQE